MVKVIPMAGTRRSWSLPGLVLLIASACGTDARPTGEREVTRSSAPTNLVVIVVDTLRADAIRDSDGEVRLPALRSLARDGVIFDRCYSHASMTLPAHVALFSSRVPFEARVFTNEDAVPDDLPLLAAHLAANGYATSASVSIAPVTKLGRGFDAFRGRQEHGLAKAEESFPLIEEALAGLAQQPFFLFAHLADPHDPYRAHGTVERTAEILIDGEVVDRLATSMAPTWRRTLRLTPGEHRVEARSEDSFTVRSLLVGQGRKRLTPVFEVGGMAAPLERVVARFAVKDDETEVRLSLWLADTVLGQERRDRYALEVAHTDEYVARILADLRQRGLYDDALIVFTSDHGEGLGEHDWWVHAQNVYDEQLHVPLIIKPPLGFDASGLRALTEKLVRHIDVLPTCLEILGAPALPGAQGVSLLQGGERLLVAHTNEPIAPSDLFCARDERYKLILDADAGTFEMYDVVADPDESVNVFAERGAQRVEWQRMLTAIASIGRQDGEAGMDDDMRAQLDALGY
jgi:arylsulfatase